MHEEDPALLISLVNGERALVFSGNIKGQAFESPRSERTWHATSET